MGNILTANYSAAINYYKQREAIFVNQLLQKIYSSTNDKILTEQLVEELFDELNSEDLAMDSKEIAEDIYKTLEDEIGLLLENSGYKNSRTNGFTSYREFLQKKYGEDLKKFSNAIEIEKKEIMKNFDVNAYLERMLQNTKYSGAITSTQLQSRLNTQIDKIFERRVIAGSKKRTAYKRGRASSAKGYLAEAAYINPFINLFNKLGELKSPVIATGSESVKGLETPIDTYINFFSNDLVKNYQTTATLSANDLITNITHSGFGMQGKSWKRPDNLKTLSESNYAWYKIGDRQQILNLIDETNQYKWIYCVNYLSHLQNTINALGPANIMYNLPNGSMFISQLIERMVSGGYYIAFRFEATDKSGIEKYRASQHVYFEQQQDGNYPPNKY